MTVSYQIWPLDCRLAMATCMLPDSVDSIVTDPPYDLTSIVRRFGSADAAPAKFGTDGAFQRASRGFMGKTWDGTGVAFEVATWAEAYRVLKPGGHLIAFGGTRTYHRMVCAIEDAGFEIRDMLGWMYGSGFPKSHDVGASIDKMNGIERKQTGTRRGDDIRGGNLVKGAGKAADIPVYGPAENDWNGWGTALKPAHEPIAFARKPLSEPTVAKNVLRWGTGAINIEGCRVGTDGGGTTCSNKGPDGRCLGHPDRQGEAFGLTYHALDDGEAKGRFPANLQHDGSPEVLALFPQSSSGALSPDNDVSASTGWSGGSRADRVKNTFLANSGSAARFFYCPKASKADREEGLGDWGGETPRRNSHPTVKPEALMRYYCRLVTPPGGVVLDPFMGSGSTGKAAILEGFSFVGCEMTEEYVPIATARIDAAVKRRYAETEESSQ